MVRIVRPTVPKIPNAPSKSDPLKITRRSKDAFNEFRKWTDFELVTKPGYKLDTGGEGYTGRKHPQLPNISNTEGQSDTVDDLRDKFERGTYPQWPRLTGWPEPLIPPPGDPFFDEVVHEFPDIPPDLPEDPPAKPRRKPEDEEDERRDNELPPCSDNLIEQYVYGIPPCKSNDATLQIKVTRGRVSKSPLIRKKNSRQHGPTRSKKNPLSRVGYT